jgi:cell division protein FtsN
MKKTILSFVFIVGSLTVCAQGVTSSAKNSESKSYALLDLGFEAKLLHLNSGGETKIVKEEEVKKSPRSLEDILGKSKEVSQVQYHLIAGCFSNIKNANRFAEELSAEGYDSRVIGQNEHGLHMVCYTSLDTEDDALSLLNELDAVGKSSWIRKQ